MLSNFFLFYSSPNTTCTKSGLKLEPNEPVCHILYPSSHYNDLSYLYNVQIHPDIAVRREVERLPVKCANHKSGCPWTGKLKDHEVMRQCFSL